MLQAPILECLSLDSFSSFDDGGSPAAIDIGRRHIVEALAVALVVVVPDGAEGGAKGAIASICCSRSPGRK